MRRFKSLIDRWLKSVTELWRGVEVPPYHHPALGRFVINEEEFWEGKARLGGFDIELVIDGEDQPYETLLMSAERFVRDGQSMIESLPQYLEDQAQRLKDLAASIRTLRPVMATFHRDGLVVVVFEGPDDRGFYWHCSWGDGQLSRLEFAS